jgi:serine/threonine-protein kinase RsbW
MGTRAAYTLESTLESVNKAEELAEELAKTVGFDESDRFRIMMSVREAAVNAVLHGNSYDPTKKITVTFETAPKTLAIIIADQGKGLRFEEVPDPLDEGNKLKTSGRGIFMIRSFMDEVRVRDMHPGTELTMVKHMTGPAEGPDKTESK